MELGQEIRKLRLAKKLKQDELAGMIGMQRTSISHYETGRKVPSQEVLALLWWILKPEKGDLSMNELFKRDYSKPVFTLMDTNTKTKCLQCNGKGKLKVIIGTSRRDAMCAQCDGAGAVDGIAKGVAEMFIRKIEDTYTVEGNRREVVYHLQNRLVRNGAIVTRTNSDDGAEIFDSKKQAELVLKEWLEDGGK